jgi:hypothetical protein
VDVLDRSRTGRRFDVVSTESPRGEPVEHFKAVSFGPVGIAVREDGNLLLVRDNTSEMESDAVAHIMEKAERSAAQMGFVRESEQPYEETILFTSWTLARSE